MTTQKICIRAIVSGKVQGVFFRDSAQKEAEKHHLRGWVKNTSDGTVELIACGERDQVMALTDWLWEGPPTSEVSNVHWDEVPWDDFEKFEVQG